MPRSCPFKRGANLLLARLPAHQSSNRQTGRPTDSMWDDEWRTYLWDSESRQTHCQPSPIHCRALHISQSACLHVSLHCCLSHFVLSSSLPLSRSLTAWTVCLLLFLSSSGLHTMCISVLCMCWEGFAPHRSISSLKPLHSPLPLIKTQDDTSHYSEQGYVNMKESPKEKSQFSRRHLRGKHFSFCSFSATTGDWTAAHCIQRWFWLILFPVCGPMGPWRNAYFPLPWIG